MGRHLHAADRSPEQQFGIWAPHLEAEKESFWFQLQQWAQPYDGVWAEGTKPVVTSDAVISGLKLFKQMYDAAIPQGTNDATATRMFAEQQIASEMIVSAAVNSIKDTGPEVYPDLRSAILPWPSKRTDHPHSPDHGQCERREQRGGDRVRQVPLHAG